MIAMVVVKMIVVIGLAFCLHDDEEVQGGVK
jgi:hypothetical protein